jgi:hypothetical protein
MPQIIIDRQRLDSGDPPVVVITANKVEYANEVVIEGTCRITGVAAGKPQIGSARVWIETDSAVKCL